MEDGLPELLLHTQLQWKRRGPRDGLSLAIARWRDVHHCQLSASRVTRNSLDYVRSDDELAPWLLARH